MADSKGHDEKGKHSGGGHGGSHGGHGGGGGHGEEHEGAPEWLISFADNVLLQMGFFVILLAMAMKPAGSEPQTASAEENPQKGEPSAAMLDLTLAIREAFNNPVDLNSTSPNDRLLVRRLMEKNKGGIREVGIDGDNPKVQAVRPPDFTSNSGGAILFADRSAELSGQAAEQSRVLASRIRGGRWIIEVRGNVSAAEAFGDSQHGMGLAYERALAVAQVLSENGIKWDQLRLKICGDNDRVVDRAYDLPRQRLNQRVEVVVTEKLMRENEATPDKPSAGKAGSEPPAPADEPN